MNLTLSTMIMHWPVALYFIATSAAHGQTVQLLNLSRPSATDFYVGESFQININGAPFQPVAVTATHNGVVSGPTGFGFTDGSGYLGINGSMSTAEIGSWTEVWTVGGVQATPILNFQVVAEEPEPCEVSISPNPLAIFSVDYYDVNNNYWYSQFGSGSQTGEGDAPYCMIAAVEWTYHEYLNATPSFPSLFEAEMEWEDIGGRIPPFYPFSVPAATSYNGIDLRNGIPFFGVGYTDLTIFRN